MEQHYIAVFGVSGENIGETYSQRVIIKNYPDDPTILLKLIYEGIEDDSIEAFGKFIPRNNIAIKSLTRTL